MKKFLLILLIPFVLFFNEGFAQSMGGGPIGGGGGSAVTGAGLDLHYVTTQAEASLTDESVLSAAGIVEYDGAGTFSAVTAIDDIPIGATTPSTGAFTSGIIIPSATQAIALDIQGTTYPYTGAIAAYGMRSLRNINVGTGAIANYAGSSNYLNLGHTDGKIANDFFSYGGIDRVASLNTNRITNEGVNDLQYWETGGHHTVKDEGTYDTDSTGILDVRFMGSYSWVYNENYHIADTGGNDPANIFRAHGSEILVENEPIFDGTPVATITSVGLYIDEVRGNTAGTSTGYGIYIRSVAGSDTNYAIYDESGADSVFTGQITANDFYTENGVASAGSVYFYEDSTNGTNTAQLIGPASTDDVVLTLQAITGTVYSTGGVDVADGDVADDITLTNLSQVADASVFFLTIYDDADAAEVRTTIGAYGSADSVKSVGIDWADIGNLGEDGLVSDWTLTSDADAGDFNIDNVDRLIGADASEYIDLGADLVEMVSDTLTTVQSPDIRFQFDSLAYLKVATGDGGITTISQQSDGTDGITIGDNDDNVIISADNWDVDTSGNASFGGTVSAAPSVNPGWTGYASNRADDEVAQHTATGDGTASDWTFKAQIGDALVEFFRLDGQDEKIVVSKPIQLDDNTSLSIEGGADQMDDHEYNGVLVEGLDCGEAGDIALFQTVFINNDTDPIHLADATAASGEYPAFGIAVAVATDTNPVKILVRGIIRDETWDALTPGTAIYLGESDGAIITNGTAPSDANDCVQIIGWAVSASEIYFDFSRPYSLVE